MGTIYIGMDIHKNYIHAVGVDAKGRKVIEQRLGADRESITVFLGQFSDVHVAIESTTVWVHIYEAIDSMGIEVTLVNTRGTKQKMKTDKLDALKLARCLRTGFIARSYIPSRQIRELRNLTRHRISLVKTRTVTKNKIHSILLKNGVRHGFSDVFGKAGKGWLKTIDISPTENYGLRSYLAVLSSIDKEIASVEKRVKAMLLTTIPGVDYWSALLIIAEVADIGRFPEPKKPCSYAGLVPTVSQSGSHTYYGHTIKECCTNLKWILVQCSWVHVRCCPDSCITKRFRRVAKKRGSGKAIISAANKMAIAIWSMLTRMEEFRV